MSYESTGRFHHPNSRRHEAREKARAIREAHKKQDKRTRLIVQFTVILFTVAAIGIIALVLVTSMRPAGPGPRNMLSDGIVLGKGAVAQTTQALKAGQEPVATVAAKDSDVIAIRLYVDYFCSLCGQFEKTNGDQLASWLDSGTATIEVHPIAILDRVSQGTKYSTRAANAAACVANFSPDQYFAFHQALFAQQPAENTVGLTDEQLIALTVTAKVGSASAVSDCITGQTFKSWVANAKDRALTGPIPNADVTSITGTPTVIVNGLKYPGAVNDAEAFAAFVVKAAGTSFSENATSSATSTATPTPGATPTPKPTK